MIHSDTRPQIDANLEIFMNILSIFVRNLEKK